MSNADLVFIPEPRTITLCRGCRARIFFVSTKDREKMPVTAAVDPRGRLSITAGRRGELPRGVVLTPGQADGARAAGMKLYTSHFASCPNAEEFRARRRTRGQR
ncbi:hypothetical protein [Williamsia deligens]|uniref:Uncharacterized protein n=1 Tax=Williamsia deligens TaxID=321325 RepID=A0ABW3GDZ3_9NOCA